MRALLDYCGLGVRAGVPRVLQDRARGAHRQLGAGPPADLSRRDRGMAAPTSRISGRSRRRWARCSMLIRTRPRPSCNGSATIVTALSATAVDKPRRLCRNARHIVAMGAFDDAYRFRALTLGLLASTALATPALAQPTQPQTTGQSPAPGTNATDVTAPPPAVQQAQDGQRARPDRDHHHRDQARRESPERPDQRPGDRHAAARPAQHLELRGLHQAAAVGVAS